MRKGIMKSGLTLIGFSIFLAVLLYVYMYDIPNASVALGAGIIYGVLPIVVLGLVLILVGYFAKDKENVFHKPDQGGR